MLLITHFDVCMFSYNVTVNKIPILAFKSPGKKKNIKIQAKTKNKTGIAQKECFKTGGGPPNLSSVGE